MTFSTEEQHLRLAEREQSLADARAALRDERERLATDRAETDRLLADARLAHRDATRERDRAGRLAARFVRWVKHQHAAARTQLEEREAQLAAGCKQVAAEFARVTELRSEFLTAAAATRDRLRDAWAVVETQQHRAAADWSEAERYFAEQSTQLEAHAAELAKREKAVADQRARAEGESVGLREEAAALEARAENARAALAELEAHRDRVRAELLGTEPPPELAAIAGPQSGDLTATAAALAREKLAVAALKASLERETAALGDRRRVVAEQFRLLANTRKQWQAAERQTVVEMEEMARDLEHRAADLDARERRLIRSDTRRRNDAFDLWQLHLRLEAWQAKLTAFEMRWHTEREELEADLERRTAVVAARETQLEGLFAIWEKAREGERERLRAELDFWVADRERLAKAEAEFDLQRQLHDAELSTCAARALAAEQVVAAAMQDSGSDRIKRRLAVMRKRWERLFDRKVKEIDTRRAEATAEFAALTERYRRLHAFLVAVVTREEAANNAAAAADLERVNKEPTPESTRLARPDTALAELAALREEVERLAGFMLDMELPEPLDLPEQELPWGAEEQPAPASVFQFDNNSCAA